MRFHSVWRWVLVVVLASAVGGKAQTGAAKSSASGGPSLQPGAPASYFGAVKPVHWPADLLAPGADPENRVGMPLVEHVASDQKQFWFGAAHWDREKAMHFASFATFTGMLIASDSWMSRQVPASHIATSRSLSNYGTYSLAAASGGAFLFGHMTHNDHLQESGFLSGEAIANSLAVAYLLNGITRRPRPYEGNGNGQFFRGGTSFPSEHSAVAWSVASVLAHEYPGPMSKFLAYGLATAVTLTRVTGKEHFPSDAVVGSALGWYLGRQVYRAHHDPELGGAPWGKLHFVSEAGPPRPENMGSPYVPLDSWVYPALERLAALGYIHTGYLGLRPWTRMECSRLVQEADDNARYESDGEETSALLRALENEFQQEAARRDGAPNLGARVDSIYTRVTSISGTPLTDGYHFGQTLVNDYGRPYAEGFNDVTGMSASAVAGPFSVYLRGEYQRAPALAAYPTDTLQAIAVADGTLPVSNARAPIDRLHLLEGSIAFQYHNLRFSFGKQSLWLGTGESGPLLFSDNAEPVVMFRIDKVSPTRIPLLSRLFGPERSEYFIGQLAGTQFEYNDVNNTLLGPGNITPQPFLQGYKSSFKPTDNFEFGMGFTAEFAGPGLPFTWGNFLRTFYSHTSGSNNPGKRISEVDFNYRVPGLRKWLTIYNDAMVVDEFSPIGSSRAVVNPGIYMPQIPKLPRTEFRAEGIHDPLTNEFPPGFVYYGSRRYRSGYTNQGDLLGSWVGRAGRGAQAWLTYSFSPRNRIQLGYRLQEVSKDFLGGGRLADYSARGEFKLSSTLAVSGFLQYEPWRFPALTPTPQANVTASVQLTFYPKWRPRKSPAGNNQ